MGSESGVMGIADFGLGNEEIRPLQFTIKDKWSPQGRALRERGGF